MNKKLKSVDLIGLKGCYIAGGAVLSEVTQSEINDLDIYPKSEKDFVNIFYDLLDAGCFVIDISNRAVTFKCNDHINEKGERLIIQVIIFDWFDHYNKIFEYFDFTVCMGAFDCDSKEFFFHEDYFIDVSRKNLSFNPKTRFPTGSLLRVKKYENRGYHISKSDLIKISLSISNKGIPSSWEEFSKEIGGYYGKEIKFKTDERFDFDSAISFLDKNNFNYVDESGIFEGISFDGFPELISRFAKGEVVRYFKIGDDVIKNFDHGYFVVGDNTILNKIPKKMTEVFDSLQEVDDQNYEIFAYKKVKDLGDGKFGPLFYSGVTYKVGEEASCGIKPYLFACLESNCCYYATAEKNFVVKVSTNLGNIRRISGRNIQTDKLKVLEIVE